MKTRFIINPRSGHVSRVLTRVRASAAEMRAEVVFTERPRHAAELAARARADACEVIVAVGGDGTLNEVAGALIGSSAVFGLVPCGSGNGLGRHLGIHGSVESALRLLRSGEPRLIDTGVADGHAFFTVAGLGFEAEVADRFNRLARRGFRRYLTTSVSTFWSHRSLRCVIESERAVTTLPVFTLAVANCDQYGNGARIAPGAEVDDGLLDLVAIPPITVGNALPLFVRLFSGTVDRARQVMRLRGTSFSVERPAPGPIHTDGEVHSAPARVVFTVRPRSLRVLVPAKAAVR